MKKKLKKVRAIPLVRKTNWHCVGYVYRFDGSKFLAEFPAIIYNKMPDVPGIIRIGKDHFVCMDTNPLTYRQSVCLKAEAR
jgi:hypothetical protein